MARDVNLTTKDFQSETAGTIITDKRKFGVEIEVLSKTSEAISDLDAMISKSFGFHHDGSVKGNGIGVEIVTPIMSGKVGEETLFDLLQKMSDLKFETNYTCGLHVHHDATHLLPTNNLRVEKMKGSLFGLPIQEPYVYVQAKLYSILKKMEFSDKYILEEIPKIKNTRIKTGTESGIINGKKLSFTLSGEEKHLLFYNLGDYYFVADRATAGNVVGSGDISSVASKNDVRISINMGNFRVIRNIMYFYTAFNDVFLAMIPDERRDNNRYCKKLTDRVTPFDIERCNNLDELEKLWLKTKEPREIKMKKGDKYDESRYYGVNFHSLFAKYNTVEVRWHEGTLNPKIILYWIAIHQHILNVIESGLRIGSMSPVLNMFNLEDKIAYFFKIMGFPKHLEKYMAHRSDFFTINLK